MFARRRLCQSLRQAHAYPTKYSPCFPNTSHGILPKGKAQQLGTSLHSGINVLHSSTSPASSGTPPPLGRTHLVEPELREALDPHVGRHVLQLLLGGVKGGHGHARILVLRGMHTEYMSMMVHPRETGIPA